MIDNLDKVDLIKGFLSERHGTRHILITIRYRDAHLAIKSHAISLTVMIESEANDLFSNTYCDDDRHAEEAFAVSDLIMELSFLPLAII